MENQQKLQDYVDGKPKPGTEGEQSPPADPIQQQVTPQPGPQRSLAFSLENLHVGSLALAFVVLVISLWLLIPTASGKTRMELLWLTLFGETQLVTDKGFDGSTSIPGSSGPAPVQVQGESILPLNFKALEMGF